MRSVDLALESSRLSSVLLFDRQPVLEQRNVQTLTTRNHVEAVDDVATRTETSIATVIYIRRRSHIRSTATPFRNQRRLSLIVVK